MNIKNAKLTKLRAELQKTTSAIEELKEKQQQLTESIVAEENLEIRKLMEQKNLSLEDLARLL